MPGFLTNDFVLYDPTDQSKQMFFNVGTVPTGTIDTYYLPLRDETFKITNTLDITKIFKLDLSNLASGFTHTWIVQATNAWFVGASGDTSGGEGILVSHNAGQPATWEVPEFQDSIIKIYKAADSTARIAFSATNITTSTVRTYTGPDADIVIAGSAAALTSGRVTFATTGGILTDDADLTFVTDTLTVTKIAATTFTGNVTLSTKDLVTDTTTGTKVGTGTTQKLAFHNSTPVVQRSGASQAAVATTAATNIAPYGYTTAAQADAIITLLNEIRATLVEKGLMAGA